jgi:geranylgeranyl pyrophosphate synthase
MDLLKTMNSPPPLVSDFIVEVQQRIQIQTEKLLQSRPYPAERLQKAVQYVLENSGKQFRPCLIYALAHAVGKPFEQVDALALAIELMHTYSLVHDDLPAMDNDSLRRGKPTCHVAFDEATAILVGDGLQALAFQVITETPFLSAVQKVACIQSLAFASGIQGMVAGQALDLSETGSIASNEQLNLIHQLKTGKLISCCIEMAMIGCDITDEISVRQLRTFAECIGFAFQVQDDILDCTACSAEIGKSAGKDAYQQKNTYVSQYGLPKAQEYAAQLIKTACSSVDFLHPKETLLKNLATFVIERKK